MNQVSGEQKVVADVPVWQDVLRELASMMAVIADRLAGPLGCLEEHGDASTALFVKTLHHPTIMKLNELRNGNPRSAELAAKQQVTMHFVCNQ
ncbi:uncharacterized protein [Procambarus clarkii]|uniref:uncharacterized protein isoform X2 n=1 Tax=Procambarus clarkii TaxID=6728 RepID=UPI003744AA36